MTQLSTYNEILHMTLSRYDKFHGANPCWRPCRLVSVIDERGIIHNVRKSDGIEPSARLEW